MILHSKIIGKGQPLLILHGYFGMGDNWKSFANTFSNSFEVHLIDQRNHGRSFHSDDFSYEFMVEDLNHYMNHYKLNKVLLLGHSMGGKTAMLFATTFPDKIDKLIIADIAPKYYAPHHHIILEALQSVDFKNIKTRRDVASILSKYIEDNGVKQFLLKNVYWKNKNELAYRFNLNALVDNNEEIGEVLPSFFVFEKDVLFLRGAKSNYITEKDTALIKAHFPKSVIRTIANAGHWLHAENPLDFYEMVFKFITNSN